VTVPPRSRTKPGSTNRRPKVAGLRQHAHAGPASTRSEAEPDVLETADAFDAPTVDDHEADAPTEVGETPAGGASPDPLDAGANVSASTSTGTPTATDAVRAADTAALPTPVTSRTPSDTEAPPVDGAVDGGTTTGTTGTSDTTTAIGTAIRTPSPEVPTAAADTVAEADTAAGTSPDAETDSDTGTATATASATSTSPVADTTTTSTATTTPRKGRGRGRDRMAPRPEAATAPVRERPTRRPGGADDADTTTATPTRTARPTRTGGRRTADPEATPRTGRLAGVRAALARFTGSRALPIVLAAFVVVCLVLSGLASWQGRQAWTSGPVSNQAVIDVGGTAELVGQTRESIEKIFSYDFTRLDESVDAARTMSTGQFTERYLSVFDQTIRAPAMQQQLRQTATVVNLGVMSMRDDRAEVMALVQFSAQRTSTGQSTNAPGLLRLQMERVDGRWKLAELTPLQAPR
jgi:Mce-associated membrane protein